MKIITYGSHTKQFAIILLLKEKQTIKYFYFDTINEVNKAIKKAGVYYDDRISVFDYKNAVYKHNKKYGY